MAQQPLVGQGLFIIEASRCSQTHHTIKDSSEGVIRRTHKNLYLTTHNTQKRQRSMLLAGFQPHLQASSRRPTPQTARPLGSSNFIG